MNRKRIFRLARQAVVLMTVPLFSASLSRAQEPGLAETFDDAALPGWERSSYVVVTCHGELMKVA